MCTVTYIPQSQNSSFILTSNRDEKYFRPTINPQKYMHGDMELVYPKDKKAGGSWIAINNKGVINCLLNGGTQAHQKQDYHTISRGNILIEFSFSGQSAQDFFLNKELSYVEPFTIVSIEHSARICERLTEFIWDGNNKIISYPDKNLPHIWSSVTLYHEDHRKIRKAWFELFYNEYAEKISPERILEFHSGNHTSDKTLNVVMERDGGLKTVSITQVLLSDFGVMMNYFDLLNNSVNAIEL